MPENVGAAGEWRLEPIYLALRAEFDDGYAPEAAPEFDPRPDDTSVWFQASPEAEDDDAS